MRMAKGSQIRIMLVRNLQNTKFLAFQAFSYW